MDNNENTTKEKEEQIEIDQAVKELEVIIPAQYSKLDRLDKTYNSVRSDSKPLILEQFWAAGLEYRELIIFALGLLRENYADEDFGLAAQYEEELGDNVFQTLSQAKDYRIKVLTLLHNYKEKTESIEDEIEASELIIEEK